MDIAENISFTRKTAVLCLFTLVDINSCAPGYLVNSCLAVLMCWSSMYLVVLLWCFRNLVQLRSCLCCVVVF